MKKGRILFASLAAAFLAAGCQRAVQPLPVCPGQPSAAAAVAKVNAKAAAATSVRASGRCYIVFYDEDRLRRESFPAVIRTLPPSGLYFQGNLITPRSLLLGANEEFFWLWIKLREVSSYWAGPVDACAATPALLINPAAVLESLGYVTIDHAEAADYRLTHEPPFDVLTQYRSGRPLKRLYLLACDYSLRRIEYFDDRGRPLLSGELGDYRELTPEFAVPLQIALEFTDEQDRQQSLSITLNPDTLDVMEYTQRQEEALFQPPEPRGAENIYWLTPDCYFIQVNSLP